MDKCIYETYPTYENREERKDWGWKGYNEEKNSRHRAHYILHGVIWSHYWRAREEIESALRAKTQLRKIRGKNYYSEYRLDIDHHTRHWIASNAQRLLEPDVIKSLKDDYYYESEKCKYLPEGMTIYQFGEKND